MPEVFADEPVTETVVQPEPDSTPAIDDAAEEALWDAHSEKHPAQVDAGEPEPEPEPVVDAKATDRAADGKFVKGRARHNPQARVQQATADAAEARRLLAERDAELAQLRAERTASVPRGTSEPAAEAPKEAKAAKAFYGDDVTRPFPDIKEFGDDPDPVARMFYESTKWTNEQHTYQAQKAQAVAEQRQVLTEASNRLNEARATDPNIDSYVAEIDKQIMASGHVATRIDGTRGPGLPDALFTALSKSARIADITRFFGQHPEECAQWIRDTKDLPASAATVVLRSLEAALPRPSAAARADSAPVLPRSTATAPINRVGGSANASPADPDDLPFEEFVRTENARELRDRKAGLR